MLPFISMEVASDLVGIHSGSHAFWIFGTATHDSGYWQTVVYAHSGTRATVCVKEVSGPHSLYSESFDMMRFPQDLCRVVERCEKGKVAAMTTCGLAGDRFGMASGKALTQSVKNMCRARGVEKQETCSRECHARALVRSRQLWHCCFSDRHIGKVLGWV